MGVAWLVLLVLLVDISTIFAVSGNGLPFVQRKSVSRNDLGVSVN